MINFLIIIQGKMRNITFAIYKGIEYSAGIKKDGRIVLRSEDDASKKEGFVEKEIGNNRIYIKYVQKDEIEEIYDKKTLQLVYNLFVNNKIEN